MDVRGHLKHGSEKYQKLIEGCSFYFSLFEDPQVALFFLRRLDCVPRDYKCPYCERLRAYGSSLKGRFNQVCESEVCRARARAATTQALYGVENISQLGAIKAQKTQTLIQHYGDASYGKLGSISHKQNMVDRYGTDNVNEIPGMRERMQTTNLQKRGVPYPTQDPRVVQLGRVSKLTRYGTFCIKGRYKYGEVTFDSKSELYFYLYYKEVQHEEITRGPVFTYYVEGHKYLYECDF